MIRTKMINFSKRRYLLTLKRKTPTRPKLLSSFLMRSTLTTTERFQKRSCMTTSSNKRQTVTKKKTASQRVPNSKSLKWAMKRIVDQPRTGKETEHRLTEDPHLNVIFLDIRLSYL